MTLVLKCLGNAWNDPGPSHDAYARPAALHAPTEHDAASGDGTWPNAPWCHPTWWTDAWTDARTDASAGSFRLPSDRFCTSLDLIKNNNLCLFLPPAGFRKSSQSHSVPHQPARGDERTHALHALQPVSSISAPCVVFLCVLTY